MIDKSSEIIEYSSESTVLGDEVGDLYDAEVVQKPPHRPKSRTTCSSELREMVLRRYPGLKLNDAYMCLMKQLLFPDNTDWDKGTIILCSCKTLAVCEDKEEQCKSGNHNTGSLLERFQQDVLPDFKWNEKIPGEKCRTVAELGIDEDILVFYKAEIEQPVSKIKNRVYFESGNKFDRRQQSSERKMLSEFAEYMLENAPHKESERLLRYMNARSSNVFAKIKPNLDAAYVAARGIQNERKKLDALRNLRAIEDQPQPFYQPSSKGRTPRIFSLNISLLTLRSEIRKILTKDWSEYDLTSAQLAIISKLWVLPEVREFLESNQSIWQSLYDHMGFGSLNVPMDDVKPVLKRSLYALIYGMQWWRIRDSYLSSLDEYIDDPKALFFSHPIIDSLYQMRDIKLDEIEKAGGAKDIYGRWIAVDPKKKVSRRSVMSQLAQAVELKLLMPVLDIAESATEEFVITLWQHDGFSVAFRNNSKKERWHNRIISAVENEAKSLGIPTRLEVSI